MVPLDELRPTRGVRIPVGELTIRASRSSGPGGQHANVTASRIEVAFDVLSSPSLSEAQQQRVIAKVGPVVRAVAQDARSQARNRELALARLEAKLASALHVQSKRRGTKPTRSSQKKRVAAKQQRGAVKRNRQRPSLDD
jgi:ribosome-associated protein